jgi:hypothetical protein
VVLKSFGAFTVVQSEAGTCPPCRLGFKERMNNANPKACECAETIAAYPMSFLTGSLAAFDETQFRNEAAVHFVKVADYRVAVTSAVAYAAGGIKV